MASGEAKPLKPTLRETLLWYRREAKRASISTRDAAHPASPELEVRLQDVDYDNFAAIYEALCRGKDRGGQALPVGPGELTQVVSAIVVLPASGEATRVSRPMRIREIYFEAGKRARERFVRKEPLLIPYRVLRGGGLGWIAALSAESEEPRGFASDESTILRVKARVSFPLRLRGAAEGAPELAWRIDLTVTRQLMGSDADSALAGVVGQMFRTSPAMRAGTLLSSLGLDADVARRALFRYEAEAEFVGPPGASELLREADVVAAAEALLGLTDPGSVREAAFQAVVYRVAQHLVRAPAFLERFRHELGLKRLLPQVQALTRAGYRELFPPSGMFLTDKAEGVRALAVVQAGRGAIVATALLDGFTPPAGADPAAAAGTRAGDTILDGELVTSAAGPTFYAFDAIAVTGERVAAAGFEKRLGRLAEGVAVLRAAGVPAEAKRFEHIAAAGGARADLDRVFRAVHEAARPYPIDGLILVEPGKPYAETATYKWKSAGDNTIDFLARRPPPTVLGKAPFIDAPASRLHFLFVGASAGVARALGLAPCPGFAALFPAVGGGGNPQAYRPIQFSPSGAPLAYLYQHPAAGEEIDGRVVELRCAGACAEAARGGGAPPVWELVRVRVDRERELKTGQYFGNDLAVAEAIWLNYLDPFPFDELISGPVLYFQSEKDPLYRAQTAVTSYVKTQRIAGLHGAGWVVDVGAGKGQDLRRYLDAGVRSLIAVDRDRAALSELVRRRLRFGRSERHSEGKSRFAGTVVHVLVADATEPYMELIARFDRLGLRRFGADAVVCNLAVHYLARDLAALRNFISLTRNALRVGGQVVLTIMRGDLIHELFLRESVPVGGTWDVFETPPGGAQPVRKYSLRRDYASNRLEDVGQQIGVALPFSGGEYYDEPLVNPAVLIQEFTARGFRQTAFTSVADSFLAFEAHNPTVAALLTEGDRQYLALYGELCFVREK